MKILLVANNAVLPAVNYGGIERVVWYLGKELAKLGHKVSYLADEKSRCDFADIYVCDPNQPFEKQITDQFDVVHFNEYEPSPLFKIPYIVTRHGTINAQYNLDQNTVFVSKDHAGRYGSNSFVYNGLDWDDYGSVDLNNERRYFHFLGKAAWRVKNLKGAIKTVLNVPGEKLAVLGGYRLNINMGFRFTLSTRIKFYGMVGGEKKLSLLKQSKGLVFPVRWNEPFGLALTESLYFGCPVFGTPYGSLPDIVKEDVGFLSNKSEKLSEAIKNVNSFCRKCCHEYASDCFNSKKMALEYIKKYDIVLSGKKLNGVSPRLKQIQTERFLKWD